MSNGSLSERLGCHLYKPGHLTHYIQAMHPYEGPTLRGRIASVHDDGIITFVTDDEVVRLWHHDPRRAAACADAHNGEVLYRVTRGLLVIGNAPLCVVAEGLDRLPCGVPSQEGSIVDQLLAAGGITHRLGAS